MHNKIYIFVTGVTTILLIGIAGYMFGMYQGNAAYTEKKFNLQSFRKEQLHSNGTLTTLPNGWLRYSNVPQKYTVDVPPKIVGIHTGGYYEQYSDGPLPTAVYETGGMLDVNIFPAYATMPIKRIFNVALKKGVAKGIIPNTPGDNIFDSSGSSAQRIATQDVPKGDLLAFVESTFHNVSINGTYGSCHFKQIISKKTAYDGTFDIIVDPKVYTKGLSSACNYYADVNYGYEPTVIKYSPSLRRAMVMEPYQGCHWEIENHECADQKIMDSFHFSQ